MPKKMSAIKNQQKTKCDKETKRLKTKLKSKTYQHLERVNNHILKNQQMPKGKKFNKTKQKPYVTIIKGCRES